MDRFPQMRYCNIWYKSPDQSLKQTESEKLQVQIQAYMDNVLDVAALLEDAENRGGMLDHVDDLQGHNTQVSQERKKRKKKTKHEHKGA